MGSCLLGLPLNLFPRDQRRQSLITRPAAPVQFLALCFRQANRFPFGDDAVPNVSN